MRSGLRVKFSEGGLTWGDGSNSGEVGGEGAEPGGEVRGGVGQRGQRVLVVVAREVGPRNGHKPLRRRHRRRGGRRWTEMEWEQGKRGRRGHVKWTCCCGCRLAAEGRPGENECAPTGRWGLTGRTKEAKSVKRASRIVMGVIGSFPCPTCPAPS